MAPSHLVTEHLFPKFTDRFDRSRELADGIGEAHPLADVTLMAVTAAGTCSCSGLVVLVRYQHRDSNRNSTKQHYNNDPLFLQIVALCSGSLFGGWKRTNQ